MTSSPDSTPAANNAICNAEVPFTVAIAYLDPVNLVTSGSNLCTKPPLDETKLDSTHSLKYLISLPSKEGLGDELV